MINIMYLLFDGDCNSVYFLNQNPEGELFLGMDNNPLEASLVKNWVKKGIAFELKESLQLSVDETLVRDDHKEKVMGDREIFVIDLKTRQPKRLLGKFRDLISGNLIKVTHLIKPSWPPPDPQDFDQLFYYTERDGKYYWGVGSNSTSIEDMEAMVAAASVGKLKVPLDIFDSESLWFKNSQADPSDVIVYVGDVYKPENIRKIGTWKDLVDAQR